MRDLQIDLEVALNAPNVRIINTGGDIKVEGVCDQSNEVQIASWLIYAKQHWPKAIKRAIEAEDSVKELEAQCAAMRKVLEEALNELRTYSRRYEPTMPIPKPVVRNINSILINDKTGKVLLERVRKLEAVVEKAKEICEKQNIPVELLKQLKKSLDELKEAKTKMTETEAKKLAAKIKTEDPQRFVGWSSDDDGVCYVLVTCLPGGGICERIYSPAEWEKFKRCL